MVENHSDSERGNLLLPHGLLFPINSNVLLYAQSHRQDSTYHGLCYTSCGALAGTRNNSMGPPHEGSIKWPIAPWANILTLELNLAPAHRWSLIPNSCISALWSTNHVKFSLSGFPNKLTYISVSVLTLTKPIIN